MRYLFASVNSGLASFSFLMAIFGNMNVQSAVAVPVAIASFVIVGLT